MTETCSKTLSPIARAPHDPLTYPPGFAEIFPERARDALRSLVRLMRTQDGGEWQMTAHGARVRVPASDGLMRTLARLHKQIRRKLADPLSTRMAARTLGMEKRDLARLRQQGLLVPDRRLEAGRQGRRYQYAAYGVPELIAFALARMDPDAAPDGPAARSQPGCSPEARNWKLEIPRSRSE